MGAGCCFLTLAAKTAHKPARAARQGILPGRNLSATQSRCRQHFPLMAPAFFRNYAFTFVFSVSSTRSRQLPPQSAGPLRPESRLGKALLAPTGLRSAVPIGILFQAGWFPARWILADWYQHQTHWFPVKILPFLVLIVLALGSGHS